MNGLTDFLGRVVRSLTKLVLGLALAVFVLSLLLAVLVVVLVSSLWALLMGRKPTPVLMFQHFRQASQRYAGGVWPGRAGGGRPSASAPPFSARGTGRDDVVDVQAHEVPEPTAPGAAPRSGSDPIVRLP
jgi:hypothetical protein